MGHQLKVRRVGDALVFFQRTRTVKQGATQNRHVAVTVAAIIQTRKLVLHHRVVHVASWRRNKYLLVVLHDRMQRYSRILNLMVIGVSVRSVSLHDFSLHPVILKCSMCSILPTSRRYGVSAGEQFDTDIWPVKAP